MKHFTVVFCAFCIFTVHNIAPSDAVTGVDVSTKVSQDKWQCLKNKGHIFAIIRIYKSNGEIDKNGDATIKNARQAGFTNVDGYIFPCYRCGNAKKQVRDAVKNLKDNNAKVNEIWVDVEGTRRWGKKPKDNVDFINDVVDEVKAQGYTPAMYTSSVHWIPITNNTKQFGNLKLWYAHYDNQTNFNDFKPFGGWTRPAIKQYIGDTTECGIKVDKDWYPID